MRVVVRRLIVLAATSAAGLGLVAPAHADTVVVPGGSRLDDRTSLTYVPCADFFGADAVAPQLRINRGPATPPLGRRSFGLALPGTGTAAGVVHQTLSMGSLGEVSLAVSPERATRGVSYVWYASPDLPAGQAWLGRADLSAAPGWQRVDVGATAFAWQAYDLTTRQPLGGLATARISDFVTAHGDGPGYVVSGFGCDGSAFNLDSVRFGATTFDLEGFTAATWIAAEPAAPGKPVTLRGWSTRDGGPPLGDPLFLERLVPGTSRWEPVVGPVLGGADAVIRTTVSPEVATHYRWRMADSQYADANASEPVLVAAVAPAAPVEPQDGAAKDGAAKEGAAKEGEAKDGGVKDGGAEDGR